MLKVFVPKEVVAGETRVAATPETVKRMVKLGLEPWVETGAGEAAFMPDRQFTEAGAKLVSAEAGFTGADIVLKVAPCGASPRLAGRDEASLLKAGALLIGFCNPHRSLPMVRTLASRKVTALGMELVPRITRAQKMDALSSQASIAGYKAVLIAANQLPRYVPMLVTAAGTIASAKVVILGAGVAGLQAIATARRLGAVVWVSDVRPAVKEQVESLGGKFIDLPMQESGEGQGGYAREMTADFLNRQRAIVTEHVRSADAVITTAQIPGKPAPRLLSADMVDGMKPGSVIVDIAAEQGGNCELTRAGQEIVRQGVRILGVVNLPASMPFDASVLYARNVVELLGEIVKDGKLKIDLDDELIKGTLLAHDGKIWHGPTADALGAAA